MPEQDQNLEQQLSLYKVLAKQPQGQAAMAGANAAPAIPPPAMAGANAVPHPAPPPQHMPVNATGGPSIDPEKAKAFLRGASKRLAGQGWNK